MCMSLSVKAEHMNYLTFLYGLKNKMSFLVHEYQVELGAKTNIIDVKQFGFILFRIFDNNSSARHAKTMRLLIKFITLQHHLTREIHVDILSNSNSTFSFHLQFFLNFITEQVKINN